MNGSAHSAASVTDITLKRGPAGKFGSLFDFSCTVGAVETEFSPAVRFCSAVSARFNNKCWFNRRRKPKQIIRTRVGSCRRVDRGLFRDVCVMKAKVQNQHNTLSAKSTDIYGHISGRFTLCLPAIEVFHELWVWICAGSESWQSQLPVDFD